MLGRRHRGVDDRNREEIAMADTWVLIAHRSGARIVSWAGPGSGLELVETIEHPEGRLRPHEIDADRPGRVHDRMGSHRHGVSREESATDHVAHVFAKSLADRLRTAVQAHAVKSLVLVAGPKMLGNLRAALDKETAALVTGVLDRDLQEVPLSELPGHLIGTVLH
jgi:protein required for attachment to host cells